MAFQVSPGVEVKEIDLTNVIPAVSTSIGAFAGHFSWGPVGEVKLVSSEKELINEYGTPVDTTTGGQYDNYTSFLQAASFLKYSNTLRISRACSADAKNAAASSYGAVTDVVTINNEDAFESLTSFSPSGGSKPGVIQARYPGTAGNGLKLQLATGLINSGNFTLTNLNDMVSASAGTSAWASKNSSLGYTSTDIDANDEIHIAVIDEDGLFSGVKGSVLEVFEGLSLYSDALKDGGSNYYKTVINRDSDYVYINEAALVSTSFNSSPVGGVSYAVPGDAATSGKLFGEIEFKNIVEFKDAILARPEKFIRGFSEHLLSYALGRELKVTDKLAVDRITGKAMEDHGRFSTVILEVAMSHPFRNKKIKKAK